MDPSYKAKPTYSTLRTAILKLTPGDLKCKLYCKGVNCKYCTTHRLPKESQALEGIYSTWVSENILAMARPLKEHFERFHIVSQFQKNNIRTVFNLEENNEHSFCGPPLLPSGFTYDPEEFMRGGIFYYNFPLPDFEACSSSSLLDVVKVVSFALGEGKIAIHCHAGHGRTGMLIAAIFIYKYGMRPSEAVRMVRKHRPQSVQSEQQVAILNEMQNHLDVAGQTVPHNQPFNSVADALTYQKQFIGGPEQRLYAHIPKVPHVICIEILKKFFKQVAFSFGHENGCSYHFSLREPIEEKFEETSLTNFVMNLLERKVFITYENWYKEKTHQCMTIVSVGEHLQQEETSFSILMCFLDAFMRNFPNLYTENELRETITLNLLSSGSDNRNVVISKDNDHLLLFVLHTLSCFLPRFHPEMAMLASQWFTGRITLADSTSETILNYLRRTAPSE